MMAYQFALARYYEDGSLDQTFDHDGKVLTDFKSSGFDNANAAAVDSYGRVIVAGSIETNQGMRFALARYNEDGSLDTSFDQDGMVTTDFTSTTSEYTNAVAVDQYDRIVVAGGADTAAGTVFALARYNEDGSLDNSFDNDGKVLTDFSSSSEEGINSIVIDQLGNIVVAGYAIATQNEIFALARYKDDGTLDRSFNNDGKVLTDFTSSLSEIAYSVAIDNMGRIVVAGTASTAGQTSQFAIARYNTDGSLDKTFDHDGKVITQFNRTINQNSFSIAIDPHDGVIVAGNASKMDAIDTKWYFALARYHPDGSLDTNFGNNGEVLTDFTSTSNEGINAMAVDRRGRIVVAGEAYHDAEGKNMFAVARYLENGQLDKCFDNDGKVLTDFSSSKGSYASAIVIDRYARIIVAGSAAM